MTTAPPSWRRRHVQITVADADATDSSSDDSDVRPPNMTKKLFVRKVIAASAQASPDREPEKRFRGVRKRPSGRWQAEIRLGGLTHFYLGTFSTAEEAAAAYDIAAVRLRGDDAIMNFPQSSAVSAASEAPEDVSKSVEEDRIGPDYFSYYARAVADFLSQRNDKLPCCSASRLYGGKGIWVPEKPIGESCGGSDESDHFTTSGMDALMSDFREERLKLLLRESVRDLATEVDEILHPVLAMHQLRCRLRSKAWSSTSSSTGSCSKVDDDLLDLLANDSNLVEEAVDKYSNELFRELEHMEERLNEVLDSVMSSCRQMTDLEKQHLVKSIQRLPDENLVRVAEILQRNTPPENQDRDEIFIDLEQKDNITLWRLYYYVQAVGNAKMLTTADPES